MIPGYGSVSATCAFVATCHTTNLALICDSYGA